MQLSALLNTGEDDFSIEIENDRVLAWREEIARSQRDFDTLLELLSRDLSSGYNYEKIVEACHEYGHDALAMNWAERGLKAHPRWPGMRRVLAKEYWNRHKPPKAERPNAACIDYSAGKGDRLVAYRHRGEQQLLSDRFIAQHVDE